MTDWHRYGIAELHTAYARGDTTPSDVLDHYLARIDAHDGALKCFIQVNRDAAQRGAQLSTTRIRQDARRPLEGIPIGIKANIAVAGLELSAGMGARRGIVAEADAAVVKQLREAGAVIVGTLNMHEAALGATTDNEFFGRCLNPHGEGRTPGGSSGGSGAAVAAGLCVAALGTDTLGSVRIPAAYCGVYGLKPNIGAIDTTGLVPMSDRFDAIGPLARSLDDLAILTNVLVKPDLATAMRRSRFMKLGAMGGIESQPDVVRAYEAALATLPPPFEFVAFPQSASAIRTSALVLAARDLATALVRLGEARCAQISDDLARLLAFGVDRSDDDLQKDEAIVSATAIILRDAIGTNGVLVTPTTPQTAFAQGTRAPNSQADFTALASIAGLPALSIPAGLDSDGMPIGLQLTGPMGGEAMLLAQGRMLNDTLRGYAPPPRYW